MLNRSNRPAFVLVELVVAVAIVAVLVAVLIPAVGLARAASRRAACLSNLHQIGVALHGYANDHGGQLPACYNGGDAGQLVLDAGLGFVVRPPFGGLALLFPWPATYVEYPHIVPRPYLSSGRPLVCPGHEAKGGWRVLASGLLWDDPSSTDPAWVAANVLGWASYTYAYVPPGVVAADPAFSGLERSTLHRGQPSRTAILYDDCLSEGGRPQPDARFANFHDGRGGGHVLYMDGHARWWDGPAARRDVGVTDYGADTKQLLRNVDR